MTMSTHRLATTINGRITATNTTTTVLFNNTTSLCVTMPLTSTCTRLISQQRRSLSTASSSPPIHRKPASRYIWMASAVAATGAAAAAAQTYSNTRYNNNVNFQRHASTSTTTSADTSDKYTLRLMPEQLSKFNSENTIVLYQYTTCPFCNKVQSYLDYHTIPYNVVEVNPLTKGELKGWSDDYKKVPILVLNNTVLRDSKHIVNVLEQRLNQYRTQPHTVDSDEQKWVEWVDKEFIPLITPNLYRTWSTAVSAFDYINENSALSGGMKMLNVYIGAAAMYMVAQKRLKNKYKDMDVQQLLVQACNTYTAQAVNKQTSFHNSRSSSPDIADLNLYGVLRATCCCSPSIKQLLLGNGSETSSEFKQWYSRMERLAPKMITAQMAESKSVDTTLFKVNELSSAAQA